MKERREPDGGCEWADQERAAHEERIGMATADMAPRVAQYRLIARVLREPVEDALPVNFAELVAARADAASHAAADRRDSRIQGTLVALLGLAAIGGYANDFAASLRHVVASQGDAHVTAAVQWAGAIGLCLALTVAIEVWTTVYHGRQRRVTDPLA
jgi:hypothetical protein